MRHISLRGARIASQMLVDFSPIDPEIVEGYRRPSVRPFSAREETGKGGRVPEGWTPRELFLDARKLDRESVGPSR